MFLRTLSVFVVVVLMIPCMVVFAQQDPVTPNGPFLTGTQEVMLSSLHDYDDLVKTLKQIEKSSQGRLNLQVIGQSNEGRDIYFATVGNGPKKVMVITQQHGNEPLGTEAALEVLKHLSTKNAKVLKVLDEVTVGIIPRVNVDGAEMYWRYNVDPTAPRVNYASKGRGWDINRWHWFNWEDCFLYQQYPEEYPTNPVPEAVAVMNAYTEFQPEWMLDLHHQGTYVGEDGEMIKTSILWPTDPLVGDEAVLLSKKMCTVIYQHLSQFGYTGVSLYNGGAYAGIARNSYGIQGSGSVLIEMRGGIGQKSSGYLTNTFVEAMLALINATGDGSLYEADPAVAEGIQKTGPPYRKPLPAN